MKYNLRAFKKAERYYKNKLKKIAGKSVLIVMDVKDEAAYYSIAPLSKAVHEVGKELSVIVKRGRSKNLDVLFDVWKTYEDIEKGIKSKETAALKEFIREVNKKTKEGFKNVFKKPEIILEAKSFGFDGKLQLKYAIKWFRKREWSALMKTSASIWREVYDIKSKEKVSVGFELIPEKKYLDLPLDDYLDSFAIARSMFKSCKAQCFMGAASSRFSVLAPGERVSELRGTLLGCELTKTVNEPVFVKFRKFSKLLKINRLETADAIFGIHGKGFGGKHLFGQVIGYPSLNRKTRWPSPGGIIFQPDSAPQTLIDHRAPKSRVAFTETLPIELFIETCNIDWNAMRKRDRKIKRILEGCDVVRVCGDGTCFDAVLKKKKGHRWVRCDDGQVNKKVNDEFFKLTGSKAWMMGNLPAGEIFVTPESFTGKFVGDVVISIDQSYRLSRKNPLVINVVDDKYHIVRGPKKIIRIINEKKKDAWTALKLQEKHKSLPKGIIESKKANFNRIGELGINTNPKAKLSNYLIVNEKIANMIHIALGAGFEADRNTDYHYDIVVDAQKQKLDIYGVKGNKKAWILRKGRFAV